MTAREMTPERLAEVRAWLRGELDPMVDSPPSMGDEDWTDAVFDHVDAITADRDEARQEVAALRAQRDEIREAHRVEVAAAVERDTRNLYELAEQRNAWAARADAAEAKLAALESVHQSACRKLRGQAAAWKVTEGERDALKARLAALVEAWDALCMANAAWSPVGPQACRDAVPVARDKFHAAMGDARGEP